MTDKEKFQKTFDKLHASPDVLTEVLNMTTEKKVVPIRRKRYMTKIAAAVAALVLVVGSGSAAYAMDLGGIQRIVQVWIHGNQTNATFTVDNGTYTLDYTDDGKVMCYFMDQKMDITDKFDGDVCYLQLDVEGYTEYMTIKRFDDGVRYAMSPHSYVQADELDY